MKKLLSLLLLTPSLAFGQGYYNVRTVTTRQVQNKDTIVTTLTIRTKIDTAISTVVFKYRPDTGYHRPHYRASGALTYSNQSNITISLDSINSGLGNISQLIVNNCTNVHITKCYFTNTTFKAVQINSCKNVLADSNVFVKVGFGIDVYNSTGVKINNNQGLNRYDVGNIGGQRSHWVQFRSVYGGGNQVNYNKFEDVLGQALHPHDGISIYQSSGVVGDSIQVNYNQMRGGQTFPWPGTGDLGVSITIADASGSLQVARGNILVNPGYEGILFASTGSAVKVDHNTVLALPVANGTTGIAILGSNQIYVGYNKVLWYKANGSVYNYWIQPGKPTPLGWNTNTWGAPLTVNILPTKLITWQ